MHAAGDRVVSSPAVLGDRVWFGSDDGHLYCLNRTTGATLWKYAVRAVDPTCTGNRCEHGLCRCSKIRSSPAVFAGDLSVVFGSYDFNVYMLDRHGALVWKTATRGAVYGPATIDELGESVFIGSFDSHVYRLRARDGVVEWSYMLNAHGDSGWAFGSSPGTRDLLYGLSNEGGNCTSFPPPDCPTPSPSPGGGDCFAVALNKHTGAEVWSQRTGYPGGGGMVVDGGAQGRSSLFVAGSWSKDVRAYDAVTGAVAWSTRVDGIVESHPAHHNGTVFISTEGSSVYALDLATGKQRWRFSGAPAELNSSPSVTLDTVFVGSNDKYLYALARETGELKFKVKTCSNVFSSAAISDDGMVYIACNTETGPVSSAGVGAVYAIDPSQHVHVM